MNGTGIADMEQARQKQQEAQAAQREEAKEKERLRKEEEARIKEQQEKAEEDMNRLFAARRDEETARRDRSLAEALVMLDGYKPLVSL